MSGKLIKVSRQWTILIGILLMVLFITSACGADIKVSSLIKNAVDSADQAVKPTVENGSKATAEEIQKIRDAEAVVKQVAATYKLVTRSEDAGPFDDMANALGSKAEFLETGNKKANDTFNSLYENAKAGLLKFAKDLEGKGL
jgi:hypothetical protein